MTAGVLLATPVRRLTPAPDLAAGLAALGDVLPSLRSSPDRLQRVEVALDTIPDALDLAAGFPAGRLDPRMLLGPHWSGAGVVVDHDLPDLSAVTPPPAPLRLALTCSFDPAREASEGWRLFGRCRAWLPLVEVRTDLGVLALNWLDPGDRSAAVDALAAWRSPEPSPMPSVDWQADPDDHRAWCRTVDTALARIADTDALPILRKIVPARRLRGTLTADTTPQALLTARRRGSVGWPWWVERGGISWLGETPELLGDRCDGRLQTVALAGTRARHRDPGRDDALGEQLLASDKDRREQAAVANWLRAQLLRLGDGREPRVGALELRRLPSLQHLSRTLDVPAPSDLADAAWLEALHPTPALCGSPRAAVQGWLREAEPFDRGLYGGVLGWIEHDRAQAHVGIRGARLSGREVSIYAGAGVVRGSDPEREWDETTAKMAAVCDRLGLNPPGEASP